ncbi:type I restriction endonuclease subunit S [Vibrio parahaemolyticus]|nr:type I restriction endonuclease subunit S [Vibrio parahaemolyticus]
MSEINFPSDWVACSISDVAQVNPKKIDAEPDTISGFVPMALAPASFSDSLRYEEKHWKEIKKSYTNFQNGDVIFAKVTPCFENGKAAIVDGLPNGIGAGSSEFYVLRPHTPYVLPEILFALIKTQKFANDGAANMTGAVGLRRVPRAFVESFDVPMIPMAEQKVIAEKLDTLLAQVEVTKARLEDTLQTLKQFRQSVLAAAVSGKLTEDWRLGKTFDIDGEINKIHESRQRLYESDSSANVEKTGKKLRPYDYSALNAELEVRDVPSDWKVVQLGEVISYLTDYHANGSYKILKEHVELKEEKDYACMIRATNFEKDNFDDLFVYITKDAYDFLNKSKLFGGEILIGKIGNAGSVYLLPHLDRPMSLAMNLFALRFDESLVLPKYIYLFLTSHVGEANIAKYVRGVATKSIDKKSLRSVFINYPSFSEQKEIVRRVEALFNGADATEKQVNQALERVNNLTQSILAKAFRGELTEQWRKENPELISGENSAEALLKKIKAERAAAKPKRKARTTSA